MAGQASAATYYVGKASGTMYRNTTGCPVSTNGTASTIQEAVTASGSGGIVNICSGTYSGTEIRNPVSALITTATNQTIQSATGNKVDVILDGSLLTSSDIIQIDRTGININHLTLKNSVSGKYGINTTEAPTVTDVDILDCSRGMYIRTNAGGTFTRVRIKGSTDASGYTLAVSGATNPSVWNDCTFENNAQPIYFLAAVTMTFNNCNFIGFRDIVMYNSTFLVNITCNNCMFSANNLNGPNTVSIFTGTPNGRGAWTFNNSILGNIFLSPNSFIVNQGDGGATITTVGSLTTQLSPKWINPRSEGKVFIGLDDTPNLNDWYSLADLANNTYSYPLTFAMYQSSLGVTVNWNKLARYINRGNELAAHAEMFLFTGTGDTINAFTANASSGSIVVSSITKPDPNDSSTWTGTVTGPGQAPFQLQGHNVYDIIQYLLTCTGVTISTASGQVAWNLSANDLGTRATTLAPGTYALSSGGVTIPFTQADLYQYSMKETKTWLENNIRAVTQDDLGNPVDMSSWTCKSFAWSGGYHATTTENYALNTAGYLQVRGVNAINTTNYKVSELNTNKSMVGSVNTPTVIGTTDTNIQTRVGEMLNTLAHHQAVGGMHTHNFGGYSLANWTSVFNGIRNSSSGVQVATFNGAMDWVRTNPALVDQSNYQLQSSSPAIDVGSTAPGLTSDYAGNSIYGLPDIGGYEYQPPYTVGTTPVPTSGSIRIYSDNKYRTLVATTTAATIPAANFSVQPVGGFYTASTSQYLDITIDSWSTTGAKNKQWTATSTSGGVGYTYATSTIYTIGDLKPNVAYTFKLDGTASTTAITGYGSTTCTNGVCAANGSGVVTFTYSGGYSTHTFALQDLTAPTLTETTPVATPSTDTTPSYVFSSTEAGTLLYAGSCTPSSSTSISSGSNTITFNALSDGAYTNCQISVIDNAGNNSATTTLASFTIDTTAPISAVSISGATYTNIQSVSLSCTDATSGCNKIYYTTDGSTPTANSQAYTTPINITSGYTILKFFAADLAGNSETTIHTENFTIILGSVSARVPASAATKPQPTVSNVQTVNNPTNPNLENKKNINQLTADTLKNILSEAKQIISVNAASAKIILTNFISQGTATTKILGSGERAGVVNSFISAFGKSPQSETDWSDIIKIANGRWPGQRDKQTETNAENAFKKIYLKNANRNNSKDDAAVTVMSYGLRPVKRNLASEKNAIKYFKAIYGYAPKSTSAWDIVRAVAYSGARR